MRRLLSLLILAVLAPSGFAERLQPIRLRLPADQDAVIAKCDAAFQQALIDKQTYENQPHIGEVCAATLTSDTRENLRRNFLIHCQRTFSVRAAEASKGGTAEIDTIALAQSFNEVYGLIFRRDCLDKSVSNFHARNAARTSAPTVSCGGITCQAPAANR